MIWTEPVIARALVRQVFQRRAVCVVPNCLWTGSECDHLLVDKSLRIIDVEIKISRSDLKADAGKDKWWQRTGWYTPGQPRPEPVAREWPRRVWKHYYALPTHIWRPELLDALPSPASGVILLTEQKHTGGAWLVARVERRAKPNPQADRLTAEQVCDVARLASLRLWDALAEKAA